MSNTGGRNITKTVLDAWEAGKKREDLSYYDFEEMVSHGALNEQGGLHLSDVVGVSFYNFVYNLEYCKYSKSGRYKSVNQYSKFLKNKLD